MRPMWWLSRTRVGGVVLVAAVALGVSACVGGSRVVIERFSSRPSWLCAGSVVAGEA